MLLLHFSPPGSLLNICDAYCPTFLPFESSFVVRSTIRPLTWHGYERHEQIFPHPRSRHPTLFVFRPRALTTPHGMAPNPSRVVVSAMPSAGPRWEVVICLERGNPPCTLANGHSNLARQFHGCGGLDSRRKHAGMTGCFSASPVPYCCISLILIRHPGTRAVYGLSRGNDLAYTRNTS
jgi:hypothetical protein